MLKLGNFSLWNFQCNAARKGSGKYVLVNTIEAVELSTLYALLLAVLSTSWACDIAALVIEWCFLE